MMLLSTVSIPLLRQGNSREEVKVLSKPIFSELFTQPLSIDD